LRGKEGAVERVGRGFDIHSRPVVPSTSLPWLRLREKYASCSQFERTEQVQCRRRRGRGRRRRRGRSIYSGMPSVCLRLSRAGDGERLRSPPGVLSRLLAALTVSIGVLCSCLRSGTVPTITSTGSSTSRPGPDWVATNCSVYHTCTTG